MPRPLAVAAAGLLCAVTAACASTGGAGPGGGRADPLASRRSERAPTTAVAMQPVPNPSGSGVARRAGRRAFDRAEWERVNGVNGTLRPYTVAGVTYTPRADTDYEEEGVASWYGPGFEGRRTASGEPFDGGQATAAHRTLPMGSIVEVTNLGTGQTARLRVNDRGPFARSRILDVSRESARQLGMLGPGSARVRVRYVGEGDDRSLMARVGGALVDGVTAPVRLAVDVAAAPVRLAASAISGGGGDWAVQGGAFSERGNAERLAARLSGVGQTQVRESEGGGRTLYRVLVGSWSDQDDANDALTRVAALGVSDARVVRGF